MKKTLVDLTYFSFPDANPEGIMSKCNSTIGFLHKLSVVFETHFVVRSELGFPSITHQTIKIHFVKGKILEKWKIPFHFNRYIKSLNPDYILVHGFGSAHYLIFLKIICPKAKIILQCNGFATEPKGLVKLIFRTSNRFIDGYFFTGIQNAKSWYENKVIPKNKIIELMEGSVDFRFQGNSHREKSTFIWVGRLDENKDPITVLKAFHRFLVIDSTAKLTMVYHEGDLESQVSEFIRTNSLTNNIELKGFVAHKDLEALYHCYQYFILGSHYEGSGYALLESMACGCIPVVTDIPSFNYMTDNGNCGLLFIAGNHEKLFEQLTETTIINYVDYQKKVLAHFENRLSFQAIANKIAASFQSL
ncbi:MAG: glycosyltransferase family 4 protein [Bacteroidota bacterium]